MYGARHGLIKGHWLGVSLAIGISACTAEIGDGSGGSPQGGGIVGPDGTRTHAFVAAESVARRLSRAEIDNALRDVLGETERPAQRFLLEDEYAPYDNDYTLQQASSALVDSIDALAEDVAERTLADPERRKRVLICAPSGPGDSACFRQIIAELGRRFFRRPLTDTEIAAYLKLQAFATEQAGTILPSFDTAVKLFLQSVLQDPEFLYRIEVGAPSDQAGVFKLDEYAIASRMAFLLWGTTPDPALLDRAAQGVLSNASERRKLAQQMLSDPKAREQLHRFHAMWLGYRAIPHDAALTAEFNQETTALIDRVVFDEKRNYLDLFTLDETRLTPTLAGLYGLPAPAGGAGWVKYGSSGRAGILSHGSVLAAFSKFSDTSPTQRGILVRTRLLCETISPPPANVDVDHPPGEGASVCKQDRYAAHRAGSCATCHNRLDPVGFGLENYDIAGRYRTHDNGFDQCIIDGQGNLDGYGTFKGPAELGRLLVSSKALEGCVVSQLYAFAVGRKLTNEESEAVAALLAWFKSGNYALDQLLLAYVESPAFALRREPRN